MKCVNCPFYYYNDLSESLCCDNDGDVSKPEDDIYCGEAGDVQENYGE